MGEKDLAGDMHRLLVELFPICRSLTGQGVRDTLEILQRVCPDLTVHEVPTASQVFDWTVPEEWNISDAWIKNSHGEKIVDFADSNLHVVGYSTPINRQLSFAELRPHLHTLPEQPDAIPYVTSYYERNWGFCLSHRQLEQMESAGEDRALRCLHR